MRIASKCAKVYLHKVSLKDIKLLKSINDTDERDHTIDQDDFITRVLRTIGAKLTNSESHSTDEKSKNVPDADSSKPNKNGQKEDTKA